MSLMKYVLGAVVAVVLSACGGGGGSAGTISGDKAITPTTPASAPVNASVASILINASSGVLNADGTSSKTFTIYALTAGNASVAGAAIDLAATNGVVLSTPTVVTGATGATVTMTALSSDQTNRTSTLTASCSACSANPTTSFVTVIGASVSLTNSGTTSLIIGGASSTLTATVKDVSGALLPGVAVSFASTDPLVLGLNASSVKTDSNGVATVQVSGLVAGNASINVTALGAPKSQTYTSAIATGVLAVTSPANNAIVITGAPGQTITVSAPGATSVIFATTLGTFSNGFSSQSVQVVSNNATATLTSAQAGTATLTFADTLLRSANLSLVISPPVANKLLLNANLTTVPISSVSNQSSIVVTAQAVFTNNGIDQPVANVPVAFSMTGGPGAGEFLSPALTYTNSAGYATATFTAGTAVSSRGIMIAAAIQGSNPAVATGTGTSSNNLKLSIGGQAISVAFGPASVLGESADKTMYIQAYSVLVTDGGGGPVKNQVVTLRMRPVAFSLGGSCTVTATYCSEDWNANGSRDPGEDGVRIPTTTATASSCPNTLTTVTTAAALEATARALAGLSAATLDGTLTPQNSDGGSVPSTVTTDANGVGAFNLTYLKGSALWIVNNLTATVNSSGTETSKSTIFRLAPSVPDVGPPCSLPASPYSY